MSEERFKLSKSAIPSQLSNFCDENGRMLNSEVVKLLNEHDKQYEANWKMFFLIKEQQHIIEQLQIEKQIIQNAIDYSINHQKTEIGKKALQKVIERYNEQMLDH